MNKNFNEEFCNKTIGGLLKDIRNMRGMSEQILANHLNEEEASIQAYEDGAAGLTAAQIYYLSIILSVPAGYFFYKEATSQIKMIKLIPSKANATDRRIGKNIRKRRMALGLTQAKMAKHIGISFQQIQKYEQAKNRVALSTAVCLCDVLECSIYDLLE